MTDLVKLETSCGNWKVLQRDFEAFLQSYLSAIRNALLVSTKTVLFLILVQLKLFYCTFCFALGKNLVSEK